MSDVCLCLSQEEDPSAVQAAAELPAGRGGGLHHHHPGHFLLAQRGLGRALRRRHTGLALGHHPAGQRAGQLQKQGQVAPC